MNNVIIPFRANLLESGSDETFKITVDTTQAGSATDTFVLPLVTPNPDIYSTNFVVDWGDGSTDTITSRTDPALTHVYSASGTYQISLNGEWDGIGFNNGGDKLKLSSIDKWGTNQWKSMTGSFRGCTNMVANYIDSPDTSLVNYMGNAFLNCTNFNGQVNFDTSACTNFSSMFAGCTNFNQEVIFNAPLLVTTYGMFNGCVNFNSIVNLTTTSSLLTTERMFQQCTLFNSSVTISDTSGVSLMGLMFYKCTNFDQDISAFQINALTNAGAMFLQSGFSILNYDLLLPAWDAYGTSSVLFHAGTAQYAVAPSAPATAHANMISRSWTITDGGPI